MPKKDPNKTPARVLNDLFSQKLDTVEGQEKIAEYGGEYIRRMILESAFGREMPYEDCPLCGTSVLACDMVTCPACKEQRCPTCWDHHKDRDEKVKCNRCQKDILIKEMEFCWWCAEPLCVECWEEHGHCGHQEAVDEEKQWDKEKEQRDLRPIPTKLGATSPVTEDSLIKIADVEPQSKAMAVTFRGQPSKGFTRAKIEPFYNQFKVPKELIKGEEDATED